MLTSPHLSDVVAAAQYSVIFPESNIDSLTRRQVDSMDRGAQPRWSMFLYVSKLGSHQQSANAACR
jgi:hypothetical protein